MCGLIVCTERGSKHSDSTCSSTETGIFHSSKQGTLLFLLYFAIYFVYSESAVTEQWYSFTKRKAMVQLTLA